MKLCLACEQRFPGADWRCPACGFAPPLALGFPAFAAALSDEKIGFDPARFEALAAVETRHFWFCARSALVVWALRRHFPHARSVLEIGCGTGNVLAAIAGGAAPARLVGAEAHASGLSFAARRAPRAELFQMDARHIPFRDEFDVIGAFDVIEHIDDDQAVLGEMFAACRPGGGVIVTVPQHRWLWSYRDEFAQHRRRYTRRELLGKLARAGFEQRWATSFVMLLLPVMALSRRRQRRSEGFNADAELRIRPFANRCFGALMRAERRLITAGFSLPFGGSLLAVAHKPLVA